ncbi:hypothetical protein [Xylophilus sp. Leaf220]|nr:hypothetical protein [Xylophilus sp. Leaf220]
MRIDTRPYVELDGPHRPRRRLAVHAIAYLLVVAILVCGVVVSMAAPLPY